MGQSATAILQLTFCNAPMTLDPLPCWLQQAQFSARLRAALFGVRLPPLIWFMQHIAKVFLMAKFDPPVQRTTDGRVGHHIPATEFIQNVP